VGGQAPPEIKVGGPTPMRPPPVPPPMHMTVVAGGGGASTPSKVLIWRKFGQSLQNL